MVDLMEQLGREKALADGVACWFADDGSSREDAAMDAAEAGSAGSRDGGERGGFGGRGDAENEDRGGGWDNWSGGRCFWRAAHAARRSRLHGVLAMPASGQAFANWEAPH